MFWGPSFLKGFFMGRQVCVLAADTDSGSVRFSMLTLS